MRYRQRTTNDLLYRFGAAIGIGFLTGLQREFASGRDHGQLEFAGVRTFTLEDNEAKRLIRLFPLSLLAF
jgi:hypothetical protein